MRSLFVFTALLFAALNGPASAGALDGFTGKKHVILLFSKSRSLASLDEQLALLRSRRPDLKERDVIVLVTAGNQDTIAAIGYAGLAQGTALRLKGRFKPHSVGLTVVLVSKGGGEEMRWNKVVDPQRIFDLIDKLPAQHSTVPSSG